MGVLGFRVSGPQTPKLLAPLAAPDALYGGDLAASGGRAQGPQTFLGLRVWELRVESVGLWDALGRVSGLYRALLGVPWGLLR